jgi:signal transduction histidine kinase
LQNRVSPQLIALIVVVALPFAAVMAHLWHKAVQESSAAATELLRLTTARVVSDLQRMHRQSEWMLGQLAAAPEVRNLRADACQDEARLLRRLHPEFMNLIIWDRSGRVVCSAMPVPPGVVAFGSTTEAFARTLATNKFQVSNVFVGHIAKLHVVLFTYPILDAEGHAVGVLSAGVSLRHFDHMLAGLDLPSDSAIAVLDRNLTFIARAPHGDRWRGTSAKNLPIDKVPAAGARGAGRVRGADGIERLYVEEEVPGAGWKVFAGIQSERLLATHRNWLIFSIAMTLVILAVGGVAAYLIAARLSKQFNGMRRAEQELIGRLMRAEEHERARISRELHDQVGQDLTALALDLNNLRGGRNGPVIERAMVTVGRLIDEVRDVSLALRPCQLDDLGLVAALRAHVERHVATRGMSVHFDANVDPGRLSRAVEVACFRIAQEALTNVLRHSEARTVWVDLHTEDPELVLVVRDDGLGFDVPPALEAAGDLRSLGLRNMFDRAQLAGGTLAINSWRGGGAEVVARFRL